MAARLMGELAARPGDEFGESAARLYRLGPVLLGEDRVSFVERGAATLRRLQRAGPDQPSGGARVPELDPPTLTRAPWFDRRLNNAFAMGPLPSERDVRG